MRRQAGHRRLPMKVDQHVDRRFVQLALRPRDRRPALRASARSPRSSSSSKPLVEVGGQDSRRGKPDLLQPSRDRARTAASLRAAAARPSAPLAAHRHGSENSGGSSHRRPAAKSRASSQPWRARNSECGGRRNHRSGHRPSHAAGTSAVKARAPSSRTSSDKASASRPRLGPGMLRPFDDQARLLRRRHRGRAHRARTGRRSDRGRHATPADSASHRAGRSQSWDWALRRRARARPAGRGPASSSRPTSGPDSVTTSPGCSTAASLRPNASVAFSSLSFIAAPAEW